MKSVAILGANFAGLSAASQLSNQYDVSVIDHSAEFQWTPNIHEILSGVKHKSNLALDREKIVSRLGHRFIEANVNAIDMENQTLTTSSGKLINFDMCLLAAGLEGNNYGVSGVEEYALGFRSFDDALRIRKRVDELIKADQTFTITIVGGGFTGVEVLGELLRRYRHKSKMNVRVIEASRQLMAGQPKVIHENLMGLCEPFNIDFHLQTQLNEITDASVILENGQELTSQLTIWCAGTKAPNLIDQFTYESGGQSLVSVNNKLQSNTFKNLFVAGDLAETSLKLSKQAYHALDMGLIAGRNMNRLLSNKPMCRFVAADKPLALAFGDLNTYLIQGKTVVASPVLASAKEAVYQLAMLQLSRSLPLCDIGEGFKERTGATVRDYVVPELSRLKLMNTIRRSNLLQWGGIGDIETLSRALFITATR